MLHVSVNIERYIFTPLLHTVAQIGQIMKDQSHETLRQSPAEFVPQGIGVSTGPE